MLPAVCQSEPQVFNPLDNTLLEPEVNAHKLAKSATWYNIAYITACVALLAIALGGAFYVALTYPIWAVILTGVGELLAIKLIFQYCLSDLSKKVDQYTEATLYEKSIIDLTKEIIEEAEKSDSEEQYLKDRAESIGIVPRSEEMQAYLEKAYEKKPKKSVEHALAPILARAEKCHRAAQAKLDEIRMTFYTVPDGAMKNPYQAEIERLNADTFQPAHVLRNVRNKVRAFEAIGATKSKEFLELRMEEIFAAYVYQNPVHSGKMEDVGHLTKETELIDYLLETCGNERNTLFAFKPHIKEFTRDLLEESLQLAFKEFIAISLLRLKDTDGCDAIQIEAEDDEYYRSISNIKPNVQFASDLIASLELGDAKTLSLEELYEHLDDEDMAHHLLQAEVQDAIRARVNRRYIDLFETYDFTSIRGRIARVLLTKSKFKLQKPLRRLKAGPGDVKLPEALFDESVIKQCNKIVDGCERLSVTRLLEDSEFKALLRELEKAYYSQA